jgi:ABC-type anion transport system duplicated permease subunit
MSVTRFSLSTISCIVAPASSPNQRCARIWRIALSAAIAVPIGVLIGAYAPVRALLGPLTDFSRYLPAVAFIPLIMLWVGIDESAKLAVIFVGTCFQMVLLIAEDIAWVPNAPIEAARTMGATNGEVVQQVLIPAARPADARFAALGNGPGLDLSRGGRTGGGEFRTRILDSRFSRPSAFCKPTRSLAASC